MPAYALTICKAQHHTLSHAIVCFDVNTVPIATGYVAISRVKTLEFNVVSYNIKNVSFYKKYSQQCR